MNHRSCLTVGCRTLAVASLFVSAVALAAPAEFVPPPEAEREAVAALVKQGYRVLIDGDYRVTSILLSGDATDDDLKLVARCERLTQLQISSRNVSNSGLEHLKKLKSLTSLSINLSQTTPEGVAALRTALPDCQITTARERPAFQGPSGLPTQATPGPSRFGNQRTRTSDPTSERGSPFSSMRSDPANTRLSTLVRNVEVQDDLKLTSEQRQQIASVFDPANISRIVEEKMNEALTPDQRTRLKQLEVQQTGIGALTRDDVATALKLSDTQLAELRKIVDESAANLRAATIEIRGNAAEDVAARLRERIQEQSKQRETNMLAVLSENQRKEWQTLVGPPGPVLNNFSPSGFSNPANPTIPFSAIRNGDVTSVTTLAHSLFIRYDVDQDGQLSDAEFPESNRTRQAMVRSGITLAFPMKEAEFEKAYTKYVETLRSRQ